MEYSQQTGLGGAIQSGTPEQSDGMDQAEAIESQGGDAEENSQKLYAMSMMALYDEGFIPEAIKMVKGPGGPEAGIAHIATMIFSRIILAAREEGEEIQGNVVLHTGAEFLKELADFADKFAGVEFDQTMLEDAFLAAADSLRAVLDAEGFQFSGMDEPDGQEWLAEQGGDEQAMSQMRDRSKMAMTPPDMRRMQRRSGMGAAMGGQ